MMQCISKISVLLFLVNFLFLPIASQAQSGQENPLTRAIQLFDKRKYTEAETAFKKLIDEKPADFMINYFYGACRTENGHYSDADLDYLEKAANEVYPIDIDYYFGVQYHAKNLFSKALTHYQNYGKVATADEQNRVELATKIDLCEKRINPFVSETAATDTATVADAATNTVQENTHETVAAAAAATTVLIAAPGDTALIDNREEVAAELPEQTQLPDSTADEKIISAAESSENTTFTGNNKPAAPMINFNINSEITYLFETNFKTTEGADSFKEGNAKQAELQIIVADTEKLREKYSKSKTKAEKDSLGLLIIERENETYQLKGVVNQLLVQAKSAENGYWQNAPEREKEKFLEEMAKLAVTVEKENTAEPDSVVDVKLIAPMLVEETTVEKPDKEVKNTGINYKIQIGAFSKGIPNNMKPVFKKISMLRKVENYIDDKGVVVYTTGNLTRYEDAMVMLNQVKQEGVKDAIIAAYQNGKRITLEQAKETEKQK